MVGRADGELVGRSGGQMDGELVFLSASHSNRLLCCNRRFPPISEDCSNIDAAAVDVLLLLLLLLFLLLLLLLRFTMKYDADGNVIVFLRAFTDDALNYNVMLLMLSPSACCCCCCCNLQ